METTEKLPEEFKKKWLEALRSGGYKQCRNTISDDNGGHCCIGVAAMVHTGKASGNDGYNNLPKAIANGLENPIAIKLINMNDYHKKSFLEIADWIEENL